MYVPFYRREKRERDIVVVLAGKVESTGSITYVYLVLRSKSATNILYLPFHPS